MEDLATQHTPRRIIIRKRDDFDGYGKLHCCCTISHLDLTKEICNGLCLAILRW